MKILLISLMLLLKSLVVWAQNTSEKMDWNTWIHQQSQLENKFYELSSELKKNKMPGDKSLHLIGAAEEVQTNLKSRIQALQDKISSLESDCHDPKKRIPHPMSQLNFIKISNEIRSDKKPDPKAIDLIAISRNIQEKQNLFIKDQRERIDDLSAGCAQISSLGAPAKKPKVEKKKISKP